MEVTWSSHVINHMIKSGSFRRFFKRSVDIARGDNPIVNSVSGL